jgi:hypothetical protein
MKKIERLAVSKWRVISQVVLFPYQFYTALDSFQLGSIIDPMAMTTMIIMMMMMTTTTTTFLYL